MITYFKSLPDGHYPLDGCALLVRDAWQKYLHAENLPSHHNRFVTRKSAHAVIDQHATLLDPIESPEHLCMIGASMGNDWHCGVYCAKQPPGIVIHVLGGKVKAEPLHQFRSRYDTLEFYRYGGDHPVSSSS